MIDARWVDAPGLDPPDPDPVGVWFSHCCQAQPLGSLLVPTRAQGARARHYGIDLSPEGRCSVCHQRSWFFFCVED